MIKYYHLTDGGSTTVPKYNSAETKNVVQYGRKLIWILFYWSKNTDRKIIQKTTEIENSKMTNLINAAC